MYDNRKPFPLERYKFVVNGNTVIAISTYAGKTVKGKAQCHPNDSFSLERGKELAAARCDLKVKRKRLAAAMQKAENLWVKYQQAEADYDKADDFVSDAMIGLDRAERYLRDIEEAFHKPEIEVEIYQMGQPEVTQAVKIEAPTNETLGDKFKKIFNWLKNN